MSRPSLPFPRPLIRGAAAALALVLAGCKGGSDGSAATSLDPPAGPEPPGEFPAFPFVAHVAQEGIRSGAIRFEELFILGDELFEAEFNSLDGAGVLRLPDGSAFPPRFSRVPPGGGRFTGPNGQACVGCHNTPFPTSAGEAAGNVLQDPARLGAAPFNSRSVLSLFGSGAIQRLAEEISEDLVAIRAAAAAAAVPGGPAVSMPLVSKGIDYGALSASRAIDGSVTFDSSAVRGVDADLVVRPFGWKGNTTTLRDFVRRAATNEMGMEADEVVAHDPDGLADPDGDGVEGELSVGDITALTIYVAAQPIPASRERLAASGLLPPPSLETSRAVARGAELFSRIGCSECHVPELVIEDVIFEEPTMRGGGAYLDATLDPVATGFDAAAPARFDLVQQGDPPRLEVHPGGGGRARIFGDLRRHFMGAQLADAQPTPVADATGAQLVIDGQPVFVPEAVFLTSELWGAGNTGPWLHDGRAASLDEAILLHGTDAAPPPGDPARSEAQDARDAFARLPPEDRVAVVEFVESLILHVLAAEEE